jgi:hypothetical protein
MAKLKGQSENSQVANLSAPSGKPEAKSLKANG